MGGVKEKLEDEFPTAADFMNMQRSAALGHVKELRQTMDEWLFRLKYFKEAQLSELELHRALDIVVDIERTLE